MMKLTSILFLVFLSSCTPFAKIFFGYRDPKPEDKKSLTKYLNRKNISAENILVLTDSLNYYRRIKEIKDFPEIRVFNKSGELIFYRDTLGTCSAPAYEFTTAICRYANSIPNHAKTVMLESKNLMTLDNTPKEISADGNYDYYVFIYWARFLGRLNKTKTRVWEENLKNVKDCKVLVYKVNMDWQKKWDEKK